MALSVAEVYLLLIRPSMTPVLGEAIPTPFDGQIELDGWSWNLNNDEEVQAREAEAASDSGEDGVVPDLKRILDNEMLSAEDRVNRAKTALKDHERGDGKKSSDSHVGSELVFEFSKTVDLATTQMLNSMKAGEVFPRAVVTIFHRSVNAPLSLVITFKKVRLVNYRLDGEMDETMSEMKERWTAEFEEVDYVYQNRPAASGPNGVTQGTARVFKMKLKKLF